jgi:xanthine dehydrogenase FAD-binding subunit
VYLIDDYIEAGSVAEAVSLLAEKPERQLIAGGTDLLIKMRDGVLGNVELVSIRNIEPLRLIRQDEAKTISIGPLVTFNQLVGDQLILNNIPILAEAAMTVGGPQIRDMATIGGNICNGVPSADSAPALFVHNVMLRLQGKDSERVVPIQDFYLGPGRVDLRPGELLTEILITSDNFSNFGSCYIKFAPRKAMDLAIIGVAASCRLVGKTAFDQLRISLGVAGPTPLRCSPAEDYAQGKTVSESLIAEIGRVALQSAKARSSSRASQEYREHLVEELTQRALRAAVTRAGGVVNA